MPVEVRIPSVLQKLTGGQRRLQYEGATVDELLDAIDGDYSGFRDQLVENGELRRFVNIFLNDEDVRFLQQLKTPLKGGDTIAILPALAGG